ncbi:hypothetical protein [Rhodococcus jostii]|uniref:Uncharacterized protein n=1 Tax=Rhodococcus jostii TaxID=132919 RepID=A0ABU4CTY2_RHOJO|nr:hypothetical protein [Rhodococcus jostii]MDV6287037.1 hypothetical protein [Rhodococcus jostii]
MTADLAAEAVTVSGGAGPTDEELLAKYRPVFERIRTGVRSLP